MTAVSTKPSPNEVIIVHTTSESNEELHLRKRLWTLVAVLIVCVIGGFILGTTVAMKLKQSSSENADDEVTKPIVMNCTGHQLTFVSRSEWLAKAPNKPLDKLRYPASKAIIAHTAMEPCTTAATCKETVRSIQAFHIKKDFDDIGYNFLVGGDGRVYIGRNWGVAGAHTKGYNHESVGIGFIGMFNIIEPPQQQLCAAKQLLELGHALGKLTNDYGLYGHRQLTKTISPGAALYKIIQTWEHWRKRVTF